VRKQVLLPPNLADASNKLLVNTYARPSQVFVKGEGVYLYDTEGKKYMDFTAGIAVNALGHSDPAWVAAITEQAKKLSHVSNLFHTDTSIALAHALVSNRYVGWLVVIV
jgi:acetylornithine/succinyldiaminopimelate/putrescine aminotransferase